MKKVEADKVELQNRERELKEQAGEKRRELTAKLQKGVEENDWKTISEVLETEKEIINEDMHGPIRKLLPGALSNIGIEASAADDVVKVVRLAEAVDLYPPSETHKQNFEDWKTKAQTRCSKADEISECGLSEDECEDLLDAMTDSTTVGFVQCFPYLRLAIWCFAADESESSSGPWDAKFEFEKNVENFYAAWDELGDTKEGFWDTWIKPLKETKKGASLSEIRPPEAEHSAAVGAMTSDEVHRHQGQSSTDPRTATVREAEAESKAARKPGSVLATAEAGNVETQRAERSEQSKAHEEEEEKDMEATIDGIGTIEAHDFTDNEKVWRRITHTDEQKNADKVKRVGFAERR